MIMNETTFYILTVFHIILFIGTGAIIILRKKNPFILKRSPLILCTSLIGGLILNIVILSLLTFDTQYVIIHHKENYHALLRLRQCATLIGHNFLVIPYLLRAYRLYFIFHLDKNWYEDNNFFAKNIHRTQQKWLLRILAISFVPLIIICLLIFIVPEGNYFPGSEIESSKTQQDFSESLYVIVAFAEQLGFVICLYNLREVSDDYQMTRELMWVTVMWVITPVFPFFAKSNPLYRLPILIRNDLFLLRSFWIPIIMSFRNPIKTEIVTQEMVSSLDLILQSETLLQYFEDYLIKIDYETGVNLDTKPTGLSTLHSFMQCEKYLSFPCQIDHEILANKMEAFQFTAKNLDDHQTIYNFKHMLLNKLKKEHFENFLTSHDYKILRRLVTNQEIYFGRILQTSLGSSLQSRRLSIHLLNSFKN